ncbi:MAG TPA: DUF1905 domain-containing protein [Aeromicrobium sp.]|nr:DUF1905 domain-containing protein [Aeromicrobium sp.]
MSGGTSRWHAGSGQRGKWTFDAEVFPWDEEGPSWRFARVPVEVAEELRMGELRGFGSVKVHATIGRTTWQTSAFPEKATGSFVLPVKKSVRAAEGIDDGDVVAITLQRA